MTDFEAMKAAQDAYLRHALVHPQALEDAIRAYVTARHEGTDVDAGRCAACDGPRDNPSEICSSCAEPQESLRENRDDWRDRAGRHRIAWLAERERRVDLEALLRQAARASNADDMRSLLDSAVALADSPLPESTRIALAALEREGGVWLSREEAEVLLTPHVEQERPRILYEATIAKLRGLLPAAGS